MDLTPLIEFLGKDSVLSTIVIFGAIISFVFTQVLLLISWWKNTKIKNYMLRDIDQEDQAKRLIQRLENGLDRLREIGDNSRAFLNNLEFERTLLSIEDAIVFLKKRFSDVGDFWAGQFDKLGKISAILGVLVAVIAITSSIRNNKYKNEIASTNLLNVNLTQAVQNQSSAISELKGQLDLQTGKLAAAANQIDRYQDEIGAIRRELENRNDQRSIEERLDIDDDARDQDNRTILDEEEVVVLVQWVGKADLDLSVICPNQEEIIYYGNLQACGGTLLRDANSSQIENKPEERIIFNFSDMPDGVFEVNLTYYNSRDDLTPVGYILQVFNGNNIIFNRDTTFQLGQVANVSLIKSGSGIFVSEN